MVVDFQEVSALLIVASAGGYLFVKPYYKKTLTALSLRLIRSGHTKAGFFIYARLQRRASKKASACHKTSA